MGVSHGKKYLRHKSKPHLKYYFMNYKLRGKKNPTIAWKGEQCCVSPSSLYFYAECVERETIYIYCILLFIFIGSVTILKIGIEEWIFVLHNQNS